MESFHVVVVPVGKLGAEDVEPALSRAAKVFRRPYELREPLAVPHGSLDRERAQHRAAVMLGRLREEVRKLRPGRLIGGDDPAAKPPYKCDAFVFVTDQDLFTASSDGVIGALLTARTCAVVSLKRIREAFYRRRADPQRQRSRLIKELLRMSGRLAGLPQCSDPQCVLAPSRGVPDLDTKEERFCRACEDRLFEGRLRI